MQILTDKKIEEIKDAIKKSDNVFGAMNSHETSIRLAKKIDADIDIIYKEYGEKQIYTLFDLQHNSKDIDVHNQAWSGDNRNMSYKSVFRIVMRPTIVFDNREE